MAADYQQIRFDIVPFGRSARELVPVVGTRRLADLVTEFETEYGFTPAGGYAGLVLDYYAFGDLPRYLTGDQDPWPGEQVPLLGCQCGEWGCWPMIACVTVTEATVRWSGFRQPHRDSRDYSQFGPYAFPASEYRRAVSAAAAQAALPPGQPG